MGLVSHVAIAALALAGTTIAHATDLSSGYTQCADEGGTCTVGTAILELAYGSEGSGRQNSSAAEEGIAGVEDETPGEVTP